MPPAPLQLCSRGRSGTPTTQGRSGLCSCSFASPCSGHGSLLPPGGRRWTAPSTGWGTPGAAHLPAWPPSSTPPRAHPEAPELWGFLSVQTLSYAGPLLPSTVVQKPNIQNKIQSLLHLQGFLNYLHSRNRMFQARAWDGTHAAGHRSGSHCTAAPSSTSGCDPDAPLSAPPGQVTALRGPHNIFSLNCQSLSKPLSSNLLSLMPTRPEPAQQVAGNQVEKEPLAPKA